MKNLSSTVSPTENRASREYLTEKLQLLKNQLSIFERMNNGFERGNFYYLDKNKINTHAHQAARTNIMFFAHLPKNFHRDFKKLFADTVEHYKILILNCEQDIESL